MATDATNPALDNTSDDGAGSTKLTPAQQKLFDEKIAERLQRHQKELQTKNKELEEKLLATLEQLDEAKKTVQSAPKNSQEAKNAADEVIILKNEIEELRKANKTVQNERDEMKRQADKAAQEVVFKEQEMIRIRKRNVMTEAISKYKFINPKDVLRLTEDFVKYDKDLDDFIVVNENGTPRINSTTDPMSLSELYLEFGTLNKHHVQADAVAGFGSSESRSKLNTKGWALEDVFGKNSDINKANELFNKDRAKYEAMRKEAKEKKLI